jgi:hypothetical protein
MSLNKFTDSDVRKEWMNINAKDIRCETLECDNPPWGHGAGFPLTPFTTYNALDVSGINHIYLTTDGSVTINSFANGVDGQLLTIFNGFGGVITLNHLNAVGAPGEQVLYLQDGLNNTLPKSPLLMGTASCMYVASQSQWLVYAQ